MKRKTVSSEAKTTYLLIMKDGSKQKITCPTKWSITFGPLCPGTKDFNGSSATSLRFRDGSHQKAVFTGVESFRDMSIGIEEEINKTQQETFYKHDENGEEKQVIVEGTVKEWINPDAPRRTTTPSSNMPKLLAASNVLSFKE